MTPGNGSGNGHDVGVSPHVVAETISNLTEGMVDEATDSALWFHRHETLAVIISAHGDHAPPKLEGEELLYVVEADDSLEQAEADAKAAFKAYTANPSKWKDDETSTVCVFETVGLLFCVAGQPFAECVKVAEQIHMAILGICIRERFGARPKKKPMH